MKATNTRQPNDMEPTFYTFVVDIQDGYAKFRAAFHYPHGDKSVKDICDAISRELGIAPLSPEAIVHTNQYAQCPPSQTPSSPPTAPASSVADRSLQDQLRAALGPERVEQLQHLDTYLLAHSVTSQIGKDQIVGVLCVLLKTVLALVTQPDGTSTSGGTKTP